MNSKFLRVFICACLLGGPASLGAQTLAAPDILSAQTIEGSVLVMPFDTSVRGDMMASGGTRFTIDIEGDYRVYRALHDGKEYQAHVAIDGPQRRLAFDPKEARFRDVLPSLRVELGDYDQFDEIVVAAGGTGGKVYESLGFAIVRLPLGENPARSAARIASLPGVKSATIQLQGPLHVPM